MTTTIQDPLLFPEPPATMITKRRNGKRIRALFVSVPFSGIEIYFRSLQRILSSRTDIETSWEFIGWEPEKDASRLPFLPDNWTLKASMAFRSRLRRLEREGKTFDVVVFNSIVPTLGFRSLLHGIPMVITVDVTPAMLEDYNALYGRSGGLPGEGAELVERRVPRAGDVPGERGNTCVVAARERFAYQRVRCRPGEDYARSPRARSGPVGRQPGCRRAGGRLEGHAPAASLRREEFHKKRGGYDTSRLLPHRSSGGANSILSPQ